MLGAWNWDSLKTLLIKNFGSVVRAWRIALAKTGTNRVSRAEFAVRVRDLGYTADVRALWDELDDDGSGFITLNELDHDAAVDLQAWLQILESKYFNFHF